MSEKYKQLNLYKNSGDVPKEEVEELEIMASIAESDIIDGVEFSDAANQALAEMDGGPGARHVSPEESRKSTREVRKTLREAREKLEGKRPKDLFKK